MPKLTINEREVDVPEGATVLDAARRVGVEVPTLCHLDGGKPYTSCMLCVVKDHHADRLIPACSAPAVEGMRIETDLDEVRVARRHTLELLLSEHVGDCEAPCRRACPAGMNIPLMIRQIRAGAMAQAIRTVKADIALPGVLGRICPAPCEKVCRRKDVDAPVAVCLLKRYAADTDLAAASPWLPTLAPSTGKRVAIVGAGPTGLAAAWHLLRQGHECVVFDEHEAAGGTLRYGVSREALPLSVLEAEIEIIRSMGAVFRFGSKLGHDVSLEELNVEFHAVVLALGAMDPERLRALGIDPAEVEAGAGRRTYALGDQGLFAGGGLVRPLKMAVTAVAHGKAMAASVGQWLAGRPVTGPLTRFDSRLGRVSSEDLAAFTQDADLSPRVRPVDAYADEGLGEAEARQEAGRCLHCDCRKAVDCRLRQYAEDYGADQKHFAGRDRPAVECVLQHADVVYESGKCIKCGLCVRITEQAGETLGLTFIGRGFAVRVGVPLNATLAEGLTQAAAACVDACPTGALSFRDT